MVRIRYCALVLAVASIGAFGAGAARADGEWTPVGISDLQGEADWTGFYIGGKLGGSSSNISWTSPAANLFDPLGSLSPVDFSPSGFVGGIIGGGNLQVGHWVFGAEFTYSDFNFSQTTTSPFLPATDTFSNKLDWIGTIEGRVGYSFYNFLLFGKGGWAAGNATLTGNSSVNGTFSISQLADGWTIGGGVELLCWSNVVLGLEYDYIRLSLANSGSCPLCASGIVAGTPPTIGGDANINAVMFRASYLFPPED
jgi:outer membrane immunogenic protein